MPSDPRRKSRPTAGPPDPKAPPALPPAPADDPVELERLRHGRLIPAVIFASALAPMLRGKDPQDGVVYAIDAFARMDPRDPVEEMLIAQLLAAHARVLHLSGLANKQTGLDQIRTIHEYADRASNTYRRLMLALAEYRRPPRLPEAPPSFTQTNIAAQQIIQTNGPAPHAPTPPGNATNEQGFTPERPGRPAGPSAPPLPALPAESERIDLSSLRRREGETVAAVHRPAHTRRQGPLPDERDAAR